ncbi:outer membrane protein [Bradyrhizobium sp.]|jgi:outer membrane immunogenic protein|uniref:outer membrane protein n=1 Tax=Bradyrhizobium sp. TaxID=376 RepID=UPI003C17C092
MKRILLSTASLGVLSLLTPALAADLPYAKAPPPSVYDWTGAYVGVFGGGGVGNHNVNNSTGQAVPFADYTANYTSLGGLAGGEAGYNWQSGNYLVGVEGDLFWAGIKGNDSSQFAAGAFPGVTGVDADNWRWGGTLRVRGGFTVDRWLMFFTGGYAFGSLQHTNTDPVNGIDRFNVQANGLTAGGGIAYAITDNLSAKVEYRYTNFMGYNRPGGTLTGLTANGQLPYTTNSSFSVVSIGLDFKFGGPVVAKY